PTRQVDDTYTQPADRFQPAAGRSTEISSGANRLGKNVRDGQPKPGERRLVFHRFARAEQAGGAVTAIYTDGAAVGVHDPHHGNAGAQVFVQLVFHVDAAVRGRQHLDYQIGHDANVAIGNATIGEPVVPDKYHVRPAAVIGTGEAVDHHFDGGRPHVGVKVRVEPFRDADGDKQGPEPHRFLLQLPSYQFESLALRFRRTLHVKRSRSHWSGKRAHCSIVSGGTPASQPIVNREKTIFPPLSNRQPILPSGRHVKTE